MLGILGRILRSDVQFQNCCAENGIWQTTKTVKCRKPIRTMSEQARSQACVSGVAKLHCRNHVVQNLRAYFILFRYHNQMDNVCGGD